MSKKEKDIFEEIGDKIKELGEEIKPHIDKAEEKFTGFDKAIEPSLEELSTKPVSYTHLTLPTSDLV